METIIICEVTEYEQGVTMRLNEFNKFTITEKALIIDFCDSDKVLLHSSEIELSEAIKLANIILTLNK